MAWLLSALSSLTGSQTGRKIAGGLIVAASVAVAVCFIFRKGADAERLKQAQASLDALRARVANDDEIARLPRAARRAELAQWVRDPGEKN